MPWILDTTGEEFRSEEAALEAARSLPELAGCREVREGEEEIRYFLDGDLMAVVYRI
ncbi:MAG: hypothetical protein AB1941_16835 [Gemmatimonadota bacterium]